MHQGVPILWWHGDVDSEEVVDAIDAVEEILWFAHDDVVLETMDFLLLPWR